MVNSQLPTSNLQRRSRCPGDYRRSICRLGVGNWILGIVLSLGLAVAGCAKAKAKTVAEAPALQVPEPPPRVVAPVGGGARTNTT